MATEIKANTANEELDELKIVQPYQAWQAGEGIPSVGGYYVEDLGTVDVKPWARYGVLGSFVNLEGCGGVNDLHVIELPAGASTNPVSHMYEALVYVVAGSGSTSVWYNENEKQTFEWGTGALFAIPLNASYQFFNGSGLRPARLISVTTAPTIMSLFHNDDFVFRNPFQFKDRFTGESGFFNGDGKMFRRARNKVWDTNFIPDVRTIDLHSWKERGANGRNVMIELSNNTSAPHISEFPVGTYKKGHRHGPGAHVIILYGTGYSTLWFNEGDEQIKCDWKRNSVIVPPNNCFHQHFNTGNEPAAYLALKFGGRRYQPMSAWQGDKGDVSVKEGGNQIEYTDEERRIHEMFESELAAHGAKCTMKGLVPWCTSDEGPGDLGERGKMS